MTIRPTKYNHKAFSLLEIILAMGLFILLTNSVIFFAFDINRINNNLHNKMEGVMSFQKMYRVIVDNKNALWSSIVANTKTGVKHIELQNNQYVIVDGPYTSDALNYSLEISYALRDDNGVIVDTGGLVDYRTRKILFNANWVDIYNNPVTIAKAIYVNDWNTLQFDETTLAQLSDGSFYRTITTDKQGGEIQLEYTIYPDWCRPTIALDTFDLPGNGVSKTVFATPGKAYLGTAGTSISTAFTKANIVWNEEFYVTVEGEFTGYQVNDIFVQGNYAFLATTNNSKEVVIVNVSTYPYVEVGYFNASGTTDASSVYVLGTTGYVATGKIVQSFNLTSYSGSRSKYDDITLVQYPNWGEWNTAKVSQIKVVNNYLFAALYEDWYELAIANVSNPRSMSLTSLSSVNNKQTTDIFVNSSGTRAYFGTTSSSSEDEFFIIDTTSKSRTRPIIGSYNTNGMSIQGISIINNDGRAILVGISGEEYQALDITNDTSPVKCGGLQIDSGIYDIYSLTDALGNAYSYMLTADISREFQLTRGGPGGGHIDGIGFPPSGTYTSSILQLPLVDPYLYTFGWTEIRPEGTAVKAQIRTGSSVSELNSKPFVGPDNTTSSYYLTASPQPIPAELDRKQYFQYIFYLESDTFDTPVIHNVEISYQ